MKRILIYLAICILPFSCTQKKEKLIYYVSAEGKKDNPGTKERPFETLENARDAIRIYKKQQSGLGVNEAIVYIRQGMYELTSSFELNNEDSGNNTTRIIYTAYPGEKVSVMGAKRIPGNFISTLYDEKVIEKIIDKTAIANIKEIDLKEAGVSDFGEWQVTGHGLPYVKASNELFINGKVFHPARFPNDHLIIIREKDVIDDGLTGDSLHPGKLRIRDDRLKKWPVEGGMIASGAFSYAWATAMLRVGQIDTAENVLCLADKHFYQFKWEKKWSKYFVYNLIEELDAPGEFYIDYSAGKLYFYPYDDTSLSNDTILVSTLGDPLVNINRASDITFKDISFEACRGIGLSMENTENIIIESCTLNNIGMVAVCIGDAVSVLDQNEVYDNNGGKNNGVVNCIIKNTGSGGVILGGGNRETLDPAGNYVSGCEFTNCGRITYVYKCPVNITGVGNIIRNNKFNKAASTAIYLHGNNHLIEYNRIDNACQLMDDMGAFYMGRNPTDFGNIIRYNSFNNVGGFTTIGVYLDDGTCGTQVYGNLFYKSGAEAVLVGGGSYNVIKENIIVNTPIGIAYDNRLSNWAKMWVQPGALFEQQLKELHYQQPPYSLQYPELVNYFEDTPQNPTNTIMNNVFIDVDTEHKIKGKWRPADGENVSITRSVEEFELSHEEKSTIKKAIPNFNPNKYKESIN